MDALNQQNADLRQRLAQESRRRLDADVARMVPDYREVDRDPGWHRWLMGIDLMSGRVRQQLLNEAIARSDSRSVQAIFQDYKRHASGQTSTSGTSNAPRRYGVSGKPVYDNDSIKRLYEAHRKGAYAGREDDWAGQEADIFAAQREGRVQVRPFLTK